MSNLLFHHSRKLEHVTYGVVKARQFLKENPPPLYPDDKCDYHDAYHRQASDDVCYHWLEGQVGFFPLFLAFGETEEDMRMTGYQNQWGRILSKGNKKTTYRKAGEFPNQVLFSFTDVPSPKVFMEYDYWHIPLNSYKHVEGKHYVFEDIITAYEKKLIFKPSWPQSKWRQYVVKHPHQVQVVVPDLDLRLAGKVYCRNLKTKNTLIEMGFSKNKVEVFHLKVEPFW